MCNSVRYRGSVYLTPHDLADLVGGTGNLVWQERNPFVNWQNGDDWRRLDLCMCPVDLEKTLARAGFTWQRGDDPMEWHIERHDA